jgi:glutaredoxin 3
MARISVYGTDWCGFCEAAKSLLEQRGIPYEDIDISCDPAFRQRVFDLSGRWTVPLVVIDGRPVGGYVELRELDRSGRLGELMAA